VFSGVGELVACGAVLVAAQVVYVTFGFGAGLVAVAGLTLAGLPVRDGVVLLVLVNLPIELRVVAGARRAVRWRSVALVCVGLAAGVPLGALLLRQGEPTGLLVALGAFLVLSGTAFVLLPERRPVVWPAWTAPAAGGVAGVLGGLFGTAGPPLIVYYRLAGLPKAAFRGSLMAVFLLVTLVRVPAYAVTGLFTAPRLWSALVLAPAAAFGWWLGHRVHVELTEARFRLAVSVALVLVGALLLLRFAAGG